MSNKEALRASRQRTCPREAHRGPSTPRWPLRVRQQTQVMKGPRPRPPAAPIGPIGGLAAPPAGASRAAAAPAACSTLAAYVPPPAAAAPVWDDMWIQNTQRMFVAAPAFPEERLAQLPVNVAEIIRSVKGLSYRRGSRSPFTCAFDHP